MDLLNKNVIIIKNNFYKKINKLITFTNTIKVI